MNDCLLSYGIKFYVRERAWYHCYHIELYAWAYPTVSYSNYEWSH